MSDTLSPTRRSDQSISARVPTLDNLGTEDRVFPPSAEFAANANLTAEAYERAAADPEAFWAEQAQPVVLGEAVHPGAGLVGRAAREVVRRR